MAPKLTLKDLYGERGAQRFTQQAHPGHARAAKAHPNGAAVPGTPRTAPGPAAQPFRRVPGQPIPGGSGVSGFVGYDGVNRTALDQKLTELDAAFRSAVTKYLGGSGVYNPFSISPQLIQDVLGNNSSIGAALIQTYKTLQLLGGDLYQAVIGQHVFPLDNGTSVNEAAALQIWNQLAADAQQTLSGVLGYMGKWSDLPGLLNAAEPLLNPLKWPWWMKLAAAAGVAYYGSKVLGSVGSARSAFRGFGALPGYHRKRKKR